MPERDYPVSQQAFQEKMRMIKDHEDEERRRVREDFDEKFKDIEKYYVLKSDFNDTKNDMGWIKRLAWLAIGSGVSGLAMAFFQAVSHKP